LKAIDLAYNRALGIVDAPAGAEHLLELPFAPLVQNHLGTFHAAAQFSLAEAASAECLQRHFAAAVGEVFAVVRGVEAGGQPPGTCWPSAGPTRPPATAWWPSSNPADAPRR
jgi:hypothetical protein